MIGDKLVITEYHRSGALKVMDALNERWQSTDQPIAVTIAGESGSGKSEIAHCLAELAEVSDKKSIVLCQDDYFKLPPKTNHNKRLKDINWVGPGEVHLDILDNHVISFKCMKGKPLEKPLIHFDEDRIGFETIMPAVFNIIIVEGTYTTLLKNSDLRVFIDRNYKETKKHRLKRNRDPDIDFLEKILEIEHLEIKKQKRLADFVIAPPGTT